MIKRTPQEIADFFGCYVSQTDNGDWFVHTDKPIMHKGAWVSHTGIGFPNQMVEALASHDWTTLYEPKPLSKKADSYNDVGDLYKKGRDPINGAPQGKEGKTGGDFPCSAETADSDNKEAPYSEKQADSDNKEAPHQSQVHVHQEYDVICGGYPAQLSIKVTRLIHEGWKPVGGIACLPPAHREDSETFYQAMVRGLE